MSPSDNSLSHFSEFTFLIQLTNTEDTLFIGRFSAIGRTDAGAEAPIPDVKS